MRVHLLSLLVCVALRSLALAAPNRPYLDVRAHVQFAAQVPEEKRQILRAIRQTRSATERRYLRKGLAAGHDATALGTFAASIRGKGDAWMDEQMRLASHEPRGMGIKQCFSNTCGPTSVQAIHGELDPLYSLEVRNGSDHFGLVSDEDPYRYNKKIADEQASLFSAHAHGTLQPRNKEGTDIGAQQLLGDLGAGMSLPFRTLHASTHAMLRRTEQALSLGLPVALRLSSSRTEPDGHLVVVVDSRPAQHDGKPTRDYLVFDPWTGLTQRVPRRLALGDKLDLDGWSLVTHAYVPQPRD